MNGVGPHSKTVELNFLHLNFLHALAAVALLSASLLAGSARAAPPNFIEFESGHVRPIAMSPSGAQLFAVNTPNDTLEIFNVTAQGLVFQARVPVGLEPVAVAARNNGEVWVVNHLSDSVSVVTLAGTPHVVRTLLVGDEPRDIVFAGSTRRAFITTAHRGQQLTDPSIAAVAGAGDPQLTTAGVPRADVWVFDPANLGTTMGGTPLRIMSFFTDTPRALAVGPGGSTVFVAGFKTGNQTSIVNEGRICTGFNTNQPCTLSDASVSPGGHLGPATDALGEPAPQVSMIVKYNNADGHWEDELARNWDNSVRFSLPDTDVFAVDANSLTQTASFAHVGTTLFNMVVNPASGHLYVSNTDAVNNVRFEGPGVFGGHTVQGHLAEARVTVISGSTVTPRHLNKHINYANLAGSPGFDPTAKSHSLATPLDMAVTADGTTLYVAAFGSSKIGVFNTTALEDDTFDPTVTSANYIAVSGGGPSGIVLDEPRKRLYVMTRFDDSVKVIDLTSNQQIAALPLPNPESASVVQGRPMLYDATGFSGNGEASCSSCHIFGDNDDLAWDLGNPDNPVTKNPITINESNPLILAVGETLFGVNTPLNGTGKVDDFHPMKGPMTTQTLRGLTNSGAMHWRGDRSNGFFGIDPTNENLSFNNFIVAFQGLVGSVDQPSAAQMQTFTDFQLQVVLPPNPVRSLDNSLTASQQRGHDFYFGPHPSDGFNVPGIGLLLGTTTFTCNGCHALNPSLGEFGTSQNGSFEGIEQIFKIPHLRNLYTKVGMFGMAKVPFFDSPDTGFTGPQIRGFGFTNEGLPDTIFTFFNAEVFRSTLTAGFPLVNGDKTRRDVEQFMLAFDSDLAPIVGQQVTLTNQNASAVSSRIALLEQRAGTAFTSKILGGTVTECDLVASVAQAGTVKGFLYHPSSAAFVPGDASTPLSDSALRALAAVAGQEVTYSCVPPGSGARIAYSK
jgi:DNA-binding beta-propeller fold protein YncE